MSYTQTLQRDFPDHYRLIVMDEVDSTNDAMWRMVDAGESIQSNVIVADVQTAGRGQRQRNWQARSGSAVLMSYGVELTVQRLSELPIIIPVLVREALQPFCRDLPLSIKWPNDIWAQNKKRAGILVETRVLRQRLIVVIGVGINVEHIDGMAWGGLVKRCDNVTRSAVALAICNAIHDAFLRDVDLIHSLTRYNRHLMWHNQPVRQRDGQRLGICRGVDIQGRLLVECETEMHRYHQGELSIVGDG